LYQFTFVGLLTAEIAWPLLPAYGHQYIY
jgi:hypothetical protein